MDWRASCCFPSSKIGDDVVIGTGGVVGKKVAECATVRAISSGRLKIDVTEEPCK